MIRRVSICALVPVLALSACGGSKKVDASTYTCADFNKSLRTKGDNTSGSFINQLRDQAKLGQAQAVERREIAFGIYFACRGKPGSTRPAQAAVTIAKQIRAGGFKAPGQPKKKSTK